MMKRNTQNMQAGEWNGNVVFAREGTRVSLTEEREEAAAMEGACIRPDEEEKREEKEGGRESNEE